MHRQLPKWVNAKNECMMGNGMEVPRRKELEFPRQEIGRMPKSKEHMSGCISRAHPNVNLKEKTGEGILFYEA